MAASAGALTAPSPLGIGGTATSRFVWALLAIKVAFLFAFAWNTRFVMDEFVQLGWAKYLGHGLFDTVWHPKAVGYVLFYKAAHVIGWDARSVLLIGRMQTALLGCGLLAIVYAIARAIGQDRPRALLILLVLLSFSNFIERIFRTRAEPLSVFFAAAALLVVVRGNADRARTLMVAGALSGLSFLVTQKAIYFDLALGLALIADAALARRFAAAAGRGGLLVVGWLGAVVVYCLAFGGADPLPIARNLFLGPVEIAAHGADAYGNLRGYVVQTLTRNLLLYMLCFGGLALALVRISALEQRRRIALVFSVVVTALVFAHNQPWPYVFVMALPFLALWSLELFDAAAWSKPLVVALSVVLALGVVVGFVRNLGYLQIDNREQLQLVARAEALVRPDERYFDGIAMLPNRMEPNQLWLDRSKILQTMREKQGSEAYRLFADTPPKIILWSYRMDAIEPVVGPLIERSYVKVAPNVRMAGRRLIRSRRAAFDVPIAGTYALYDESGHPVAGSISVNERIFGNAVRLDRGAVDLTLSGGPQAALLLPSGDYAGRLATGPDEQKLFDHVYD